MFICSCNFFCFFAKEFGHKSKKSQSTYIDNVWIETH